MVMRSTEKPLYNLICLGDLNVSKVLGPNYVLLFDVFFRDLLSSIFVFCERRLKNPKGLFISYELVEMPRAPNSHYTMV